MTKTIQAIYENGVLIPLEELGIPDHQKVELTVKIGDENVEFEKGLENLDTKELTMKYLCGLISDFSEEDRRDFYDIVKHRKFFGERE